MPANVACPALQQGRRRLPLALQARLRDQRQRDRVTAGVAVQLRQGSSNGMTTIEVQRSDSRRPDRRISVCDRTNLITIGRRAADHHRRIFWNAARRCLVAATF